MSEIRRVLVIGAGPAGLAAAMAAQDAGLEVEVVEAALSAATSWRSHYDRLHLHTTRRLSALPNRPIPAAAGTWVSRDDFIDYLDECARGLTIRFATRVGRIDREEDAWSVRTENDHLRAEQVVVATGYNHTPRIPDWPGRDTFGGELIHSSKYRNARAFKDRSVLVAGAGNSGTEIAADLVEGGARKVWIAVRTPPNILRRNIGPLSNQHLGIVMSRLPVAFVDGLSLIVQRLAIGDLRPYGLQPPSKGTYSRILEDEQIPLIDVGFLGHLKAGEIEVVPALDEFRGSDVLCGERHLRPDSLIAATGYARGLDSLVGHLGVLAPTGRPRVLAPGIDPLTPGLYFIGFSNPIVGNLYDVSRVARRLAKVMLDKPAARAAAA
ncbi:MAG: NAD(P)/FAD-dependent oxidoreductase [Candidatus Dormibacteraeota bacterium]|nr:NAD(P)/FAD-dependent oxidoreductase [Candidatus Dormibacteraeota bacterium]